MDDRIAHRDGKDDDKKDSGAVVVEYCGSSARDLPGMIFAAISGLS
jgi:hypothetical protein